jgi:hypothetical protein
LPMAAPGVARPTGQPLSSLTDATISAGSAR